eukprot:GHVQ01003075.1.p1 GENE.GHVQ01003075.1~~GHVQ01003075.1.p1  ORF type:complete len:239 (-),score=21.34 GHVQ01003075.1:261-977(-)
MVVKRSHKCRDGLSIATTTNILWRPPRPSLFPFSRNSMDCRGGNPKPRRIPGIPQPPKDFEIETRKAAGNKRYKPPPEPKKRPDQQAFNSGNFHTMNASVKFQARGLFYDDGDVFRKELRKVCEDLHLHGGFIVNERSSTGHIQGDVFAVGNLRRWLDLRCATGGVIRTVRFWGENYAMPKLDFNGIRVKQDFRRPAKKLHNKKIHEKEAGVSNFFFQSLERQRDIEAFMEANTVRNY